MPDLQAALQTHREAVDAFLRAARSVPEDDWTRPRAPGKWSPGQVAEHLALAYEVNRRVFHGTAPAARVPRFARPLIRTLLLNPVLRRGRFIPGSKSPKVFRPGASPDPPGPLLGRLEAAARAFDADAADAGQVSLDHPVFGRLPVADFVRLQEIHTRHHCAQIPVAGA